MRRPFSRNPVEERPCIRWKGAERACYAFAVTPTVSVVIPSFNSASFIASTLSSVLSQTWPFLEVIVIDDGSTDTTADVIRPFLERIVYVRQGNQGLAAARNAGLSRATGELVAWLDADDLWNPEKIALQVAVLREHPECAVVGSDFSAFDDSGWIDHSHAARYFGVIERTPGGLAGFFPQRRELETAHHPHVGTSGSVVLHWGELRRRLLWGNVLLPSTMLFRRDAALRVGGLDASFRRDADWEYAIRLATQGSVAFIDRPLIRYRYSPGQMSSDEHLADIALSRVLVLEEAARNDASLLSDPAFRERLGYSHLALAHALADARRRDSARHLIRSIAHGYADLRTVRALAKLLLPRSIAGALRGREG